MSSLIRMQAGDFFNAYLVLKESNEAMMDKLEKLSGKPLISETAFGAFPVMNPSIVCLAFSVELYVKDIYSELNIKLPKGRDGHNIWKLFEKLPDQVQQEIFAHDSIGQNTFATRGDIFSTKRFTSPYDGFVYQIKAISEAFVEWRYSYEKGTLEYNEGFALALIEAVKSVSDNTRRRSST